VVYPEGAGEFLMTGETAEVEIQLMALRDSQYPDNDAHIWGRLDCGEPPSSPCRIFVSQVRPMDATPPGTPEMVEEWVGAIYSGPLEPHSGGDDYFALAVPGIPQGIQFGIQGADETIQSDIEAMRDSGEAVRIWGSLTVGIPDWNGTQILVSRIQTVGQSVENLPIAPKWEVVDNGWLTYTNEMYHYQISYPPEATLSFIGVTGFLTEDLPQGKDPGEYMTELQQQYGDELCVTITYSLGYIYISPPENEGGRFTACGRTGVGAGEVVDQTEDILIEGQTITAKGFEFIGGGETLDKHNETMVLTLPDGTRIEFGSTPRSDATYEDYLMKSKEILLQIIATYTSIN
jgi:hypothetical protein